MKRIYKNLRGHLVGAITSERNAALLAVGVVFATIALADTAYAQSGALLQPVDNMLTQIVQAVQGTIARSLAIIAVCVLGFLAMFGRLSWFLAGSIILGIVLVFGAATIVDAVKGTTGG